MDWNNYSNGELPAYNGSGRKNKFKGTGHKVAIAFLVLGIMAIIAIGIWIGVDLKGKKEEKVTISKVTAGPQATTKPTEPTTAPPDLSPGLSRCPQSDLELEEWSPGMDKSTDVTLKNKKYLLSANATLNSITIGKNGKLVIKDQGPNSPALTLRLRHMLIKDGGEFWVGAEGCPYLGRLDIVLVGRKDETEDPGDSIIGRKFIGVEGGGTIEMHGAPKLSWTQLNATLNPGQGANQIITLADDVTSWQSGDPDIVIASSDYDFDHAEKFSTMKCESCTKYQVQIKGMPKYIHFGEFADGVDIRAEVGLLSRNVRIRGEVEKDCYGFEKLCKYFDRDLFGGQIQMLFGFKAAHFADLELVDMGQQMLRNYPIHFHVTGDSYGAYVRRLAIHHTSSRCVTLHGAHGVLVEDVVGYDSLGHCFFLEDGNEQNNTLRHNLGLVTRSGSLLPSDRSAEMCKELLDDVWPRYAPDVESECEGVSSFWVSHPNNTYEGNAAAGAEAYGYFVVFHREPTGDSKGTLPEYHSERTTLKIFANNRAHSNPAIGLSIDRGIKADKASKLDGREFLALIENARFAPHENRNLSAPRVQAHIHAFTSYKNAIGAEIRGGDVIVHRSSFVDDVVGLTFISENTLPYDIGSHQEVKETKFVGRSHNLRPYENDSLTDPQIGLQLRDGPIVIDDCEFSNFAPDELRESSTAIGFMAGHEGQFSSRSLIRNSGFDDKSVRIRFTWPADSDGDLVQVLYDEDGSLTGTAQAYVVRNDSALLASGCTQEAHWVAAVCTGKDIGQVYITQQGDSPNTLVVHASGEQGSLTLSGVTNDDGEPDPVTAISYQALMVSGQDYTITWGQVAPANITVRPHNFKTGAMVDLALCYPLDTTFTVTFDLYDQLTDTVTSSEVMTAGATMDDFLADATKMIYFVDTDFGFLHIRLSQTRPLAGYNYCSDAGCEGISVRADITNKEATTCDHEIIKA